MARAEDDPKPRARGISDVVRFHRGDSVVSTFDLSSGVDMDAGVAIRSLAGDRHGVAGILADDFFAGGRLAPVRSADV